MDRVAKIFFTVTLMFFALGAVQAGPGDVYRVKGEQVNLRAGPSEDANVRTRVKAGEELVELQREGAWLGVRVLGTGEEGWIYEGLVERTAPSTLERGTAAGPFRELSGTFDALVARVNERLGYPTVEKVEKAESGVLRVTPTQEWLRDGSGESHLLAAMAFYEMWKNHQNGRPVTLELLDDRGRDYITIRDGETGPTLAVNKPSRE